MPRKQTNTLTDEKLKRTKLALEQLKLQQARRDWQQVITPRPPGMAKHEFQEQKVYKQMVQKLDNIRYMTMLYELSKLTAHKEKQMVEGEIAALDMVKQTQAWIAHHRPEHPPETQLIPAPAKNPVIGDIDDTPPSQSGV